MDTIKSIHYSQWHLINEISSNLVPPPSSPPIRAAISPHKIPQLKAREALIVRVRGAQRDGKRFVEGQEKEKATKD